MQYFRIPIGFLCIIETPKEVKMKHFKSYPCQQEDISQLSLEVIEDIMIQIGDDAYLRESDKSELLYLYIGERWKKKQKSFIYTLENIARIEEMNRMLIRQTTDVVTSAWEIYQRESNVQVIPQLLLPNHMYGWRCGRKGYTSQKKAKMWWILSGGYNDSKDRDRNVLPSTAEYGTWMKGCGFDDRLKLILWGHSALTEPEEEWGMGRDMDIDQEKTSNIRFCWPFEHLLSKEIFSMEDILMIDKFIPKIEVQY